VGRFVKKRINDRDSKQIIKEMLEELKRYNTKLKFAVVPFMLQILH